MKKKKKLTLRLPKIIKTMSNPDFDKRQLMYERGRLVGRIFYECRSDILVLYPFEEVPSDPDTKDMYLTEALGGHSAVGELNRIVGGHTKAFNFMMEGFEFEAKYPNYTDDYQPCYLIAPKYDACDKKFGELLCRDIIIKRAEYIEDNEITIESVTDSYRYGDKIFYFDLSNAEIAIDWRYVIMLCPDTKYQSETIYIDKLGFPGFILNTEEPNKVGVKVNLYREEYNGSEDE